jgi:uncharacterized membrane protein YeaQ/YmgE (transglycosylase-associated protein family)
MGIIWFLISLIVGGLVIGALARLALPGRDPMSIPATILLGIGGSIVGGLIFNLLFGSGFGFLGALIGAILLLWLYRHFVQKRPLTGA